jgi:Tfp pilus assembly protein PilX
MFQHDIPRRRGIALILVLAALAAATVMGAAILASSSLQATVSSNSGNIAAAESLAESGVNYALYKLQAMTEEEAMNGEFWAGAQDIGLGDAIPGTVDVVVTRPDPTQHQYLIDSTGMIESDAGDITRTVRVTTEIQMTFKATNAAAFNGGATIPLNTTIIGPVKSSGNITLLNVLNVQGLVRAAGFLLPFPSLYELLDSNPPPSAPTTYRNYLTYEYDGQTYNAELISSPTLSNVTYNPNPVTNPAGIFYALGAITLQSNVTINGTLYVKRVSTASTSTIGRLTLDGANVVIKAQDGYPALIVDEKIRLLNNTRSTSVYGLVWVADGIIKGSVLQSAHSLKIYGGMLFAGTGTPIDTLFNGTIRLEYSPQYLNVPDFSTRNTTPESVKILSWEQVYQ